MANLKSCGVLLFREAPERSFLLMRHPDRWDLPKGHVDPGETELECAFREVEEETGYQQSEVELVDGFRFESEYQVRGRRTGFEWQPKSLIIFLGELLVERDPELTEHDGFSWFPWNPPHQIQERTIDPLLIQVADYWARNP